MRKYHFRPARLGIFAIYYPSSPLGWIVSLILTALFTFFFIKIDQSSHSTSDKLLNFSPYALSIMLIFDLLCFRLGEYPSWWKKKDKSV